MKNKINVNMTPNPLDLQTLHCSQGDTEERKFQFTLHNQGVVYDLSNISDPVFTSFPVSVGGTEELQPVNGTSPSTSPIIADITYPDGLREGEEFTYRESPTTISGNANFKAVYGNTLVWNQLHDPAILTGGTTGGVTRTQTSGGLLTLSGTATSAAIISLSNTDMSVISGHKYLLKVSTQLGYQCLQFFNVDTNSNAQAFGNADVIYTATSSFTARTRFISTTGVTYNKSTYINIFDLTAMGLDTLTIDQFKSLFSLNYYAYNSGSLLNFNGTGIKTVGKNLAQNDNATNQNRSGFSYSSETLQSVKCTKTANGGLFYFKLKARLKANTVYKLSVGDVDVNGSTQVNFYIYSDALWGNAIYVNKFIQHNSSHTFSFAENYENAVIGFFVNGNVGIGVDVNDIMLTFEDTDTSLFEPYTSSILSLPISTYFPTGMKSAGSVYDELTPTKAITRVGTRAYQSGDESDTSVTTDGTNTNYALATEVVQSIMSASLITENGEAPLYHNGECLECECNEDISSEPGFHVAKIKFTYDDGTNYSNKIELHVERSPQ